MLPDYIRDLSKINYLDPLHLVLKRLLKQYILKVVYLTDGAARKVKAGNYTIIFRRMTPKNLFSRGSISELAV